MAIKKITLQCLLLILSQLIQLSLLAANTLENPEFVLAVFATKRSRAELLEMAADQNILAYNINSRSKVDLEHQCVRNVWMRDKNTQEWIIAATVPLPNVVYDFGVYKKGRKQKEKATKLKELLNSRNIPFINPEDAMEAINNKALFADVMKKNDIPHPKTREFSQSNVENMLSNYDRFVIKPTFGSKGHGIIFVQRTTNKPHSLFRVSYKKLNKQKKWIHIGEKNLRTSDVFAAIERARVKLRKTHTPYIIQQEIDTYRYEGLQTDVRVNVQRGRNGALVVSGLIMRVGGNLSQGGRPAHYLAVLEPLETATGIPAMTIKDKITALAMRTFLALEAQGGKLIGDLGMDIVLKKNAEPIVIEANNKNGYASTYVLKNPIVDTLYGLPASLDDCIDKDILHGSILLEYAYFRVKRPVLLDDAQSSDEGFVNSLIKKLFTSK